MVWLGVGLRVCSGFGVWRVFLGVLLYEFLGRMVFCGFQFIVGRAGVWFSGFFEVVFFGLYIVFRCILRLAFLEDVFVIEKEMAQLVKELRQKRMIFGYSQVDVGFVVGFFFGKVFSQTIICRFEVQYFSFVNMQKLLSLLKMWLEEVDIENFLGLCNMEIILQQVRKRRRVSREIRIGNFLERVFL